VDLVYLGAEVPSHRNLLTNAGASSIGLSFWGAYRRGLPKTKPFLLTDNFPDDVAVYVYSGHPTDAPPEYFEKYLEFLNNNYDRLKMIYGALDMSVAEDFAAKFAPLWDPLTGMQGLEKLVDNGSDNIAIPGDSVDTEKFLAAFTRSRDQRGTNFHGMSVAKPDNLRQVKLETASTMSWLSPMMRGETIVWDGFKLVRYPKKMKDQARPRYKNVIERAGLDFDKILNDDPNEVTKLAIWSYRQLENSMNRGNLSDNSDYMDDPGSAETRGIDPDNSALEVRKVSRSEVVVRDVQDMVPLPVFRVDTEYVQDGNTLRESPVLGSTGVSLRQCNTCFVASNCPAFKPNNTCAFNLPVEVKTRDQMSALLNSIIEIQAARVAFARYSEELNGGYPDPNTSQEIDRLFKIVKNKKELEENREFLKLTVERQTSGGVLSSLFGERAQVLKEIPNGGYTEDQTTQIIVDSLE
jgi:hypothetical protein